MPEKRSVSRERRRAASRLLLSTLLLPLLVLALGVWEQGRGRTELAEAEGQRAYMTGVVAAVQAQGLGRQGEMAMRFRRDGRNYAGPLALAQAREALADAELGVAVSRWRPVLPPVVMGCAGLAASLSLLVLGTGGVLGWRGRGSRDALVSGFGAMRRMLPPVMAVQVLLALVGFVSVLLFECAPLLYSGPVSVDGYKLLGIGAVAAGFAVWGGLRALVQMRRARDVFTPDPLAIAGRALSAVEAPGLWRMVDGLAERLGALRPDTIVAGLGGGFFVSSGTKLLYPGEAVVTGRTLYVPLCLLPLLRDDEVATIIGHELAHFSGGDTEYSLRFVPIYAGVARSLHAVGSSSPLLAPATQLGLFVMDRFHHAVRHWSRMREFAADAAGAGVTSADAAARALLRTTAAGPLLDRVLDAPGGRDDLVAATVDAAAAGLDDPAPHLEERQPHPTDTHPPTVQRMAALGVALDPARLAEAAAPPPPGALARLRAFLANPDAVCRTATADLLDRVRQDEQAVQDALKAAVADVPAVDVPLHGNTRPGGIVMIAVAALFGAGALLLAWFGLRGLGPGEVRIVLGTLLVLGAGLAGYGVVLIRRGRHPFMILRPRELLVPGLDRGIAWSHVADLDMTLTRTGVSTRLLLLAEAPWPARLPGTRRVGLDAGRRIVSVTAAVPKGLTVQGFADLVGSYRRAEAARALLAERDSGLAGPHAGGIAGPCPN